MTRRLAPFLLLAPAGVLAAATGLNVIPTTDLVPFRQICPAQRSEIDTRLHGVRRVACDI